MQVHVQKFVAKNRTKMPDFLFIFTRPINPWTMNLAIRVLDNIVKNMYVRLIFWFLAGVLTAVVFFKFFRRSY